MRVFVLGTGRCGTVTLSRAFSHATNRTCGHESRAHLLVDRLAYPDDHIEVDGRLSWFVGSLAARYPDALYVHLTRDTEDVVDSVASRSVKQASMLSAFGSGVVRQGPGFNRVDAAKLVVQTITDNVSTLSKLVSNFVEVGLGDLGERFPELWSKSGCAGDLDAAMREIEIRYNARP